MYKNGLAVAGNLENHPPMEIRCCPSCFATELEEAGS